MRYCEICGSPNAEQHHLVFGNANRKLSDCDELVMDLCRDHHEFMHKNAKISRIIGQLMYERNKCAEGYAIDAARQSFRMRYGKSYL